MDTEVSQSINVRRYRKATNQFQAKLGTKYWWNVHSRRVINTEEIYICLES